MKNVLKMDYPAAWWWLDIHDADNATKSFGYEQAKLAGDFYCRSGIGKPFLASAGVICGIALLGAGGIGSRHKCQM